MTSDIDTYFPSNGPCAFCGDTELGARHRVIDAIAGRVAAGEDETMVALDYEVPLAAVNAAVEYLGDS